MIFSSDRGGSTNLWRLPIDEASGEPLAPPEPVTTPATYAGYISVSQDGSRLAYMSAHGAANLESIAFDTVEGRVTGSRIAGNWQAGKAESGLTIYTFESGQFVDVADTGRDPQWLNDGRRLIFYERAKLLLLDVESGEQRELLTHPNTSDLQNLALSNDNRTIYFAPVVLESDIWMLTLEDRR